MFCPSKVMPCFDQPDLKSNMTLIVYIHEMWQAASVGHITESVLMDDAAR